MLIYNNQKRSISRLKIKGNGFMITDSFVSSSATTETPLTFLPPNPDKVDPVSW
jgi:hypothetical protein